MVPGINVARTTLKQIPVLTLSHLTNECIPGLPYSFPVTPYHFFYSFIPTACFTVPGILHTVWYRIFGYTIYILLYMSETCRFSLERCIYILYMFFTEFNQFQNFSEFLSNCDFCATISTKIQILWNMYITKVIPSIFIVNQF